MNPATRRAIDRAARIIAAERQRRLPRLSYEVQQAKLRADRQRDRPRV